MDLTLNPTAIPNAPYAIALSGGGDSTALVHALRAHQPLVLIVDHGLRAGSRGEAQAALAFAQGLNLDAEILTWSPPQISSGVQAKARQARYDLLGQACRARGLRYLLTGHTQDDQAETVLMRLKAGGSWRGAAGMRAVTPSPLWPELAEVTVCRPMLQISRADIRAYLKAHALPFTDDPSNENRDYARIRARDELGCSPRLRRDMLSLSEDMKTGRQHEAQRIAAEYGAGVTGDEFGNVFISNAPSLRLLARLLRAVSGTAEHPRHDALLRLRAALQQPHFRGASLGGAVISPHKLGLMISRDPVVAIGRGGVAPLTAQDFSGRTLWDGRFWIDGEGRLSPTGEAWKNAPPPLRAALQACPAPARATLPLWQQRGKIVAIGPYDCDGQRILQVKSAVLPRLLGEFAYIPAQPD